MSFFKIRGLHWQEFSFESLVWNTMFWLPKSACITKIKYAIHVVIILHRCVSLHILIYNYQHIHCRLTVNTNFPRALWATRKKLTCPKENNKKKKKCYTMSNKTRKWDPTPRI